MLADTGGGVAAAVDFVGSESSLKFASSVVRKGGQVVVVGLFGGTLTMPIPMFALRVISLIGSYVGSLEDARAMLELVRTGSIDADPDRDAPARRGQPLARRSARRPHHRARRADAVTACKRLEIRRNARQPPLPGVIRRGMTFGSSG